MSSLRPGAEVDHLVPSVALAVYAHPDDSEVACAGTLSRWLDAGAEVHLVICNRGDKGSDDPEATPVALSAQRAEEVAAAATVLGLHSVEMLGYPDGEIDDERELISRLVAILRRLRPEAVVGPDPSALFFGQGYVNHRDHRVVGMAVLDAVTPAAGSRLYFPQHGPPHQVARVYLSGTLEPDTWVDVADGLDRKVAALACHRSQVGEGGGWIDDLVRGRAQEAGRAAGLAYAEPFRRLVLARG